MMLGLLAAMALIRSRAGRTLVRCLAIVSILFFYKYLIVVKIIIALLVICEVAAWVIPPSTPGFTPIQRERGSTILPPAATINDNTNYAGPLRAPWMQEEEVIQQEVMQEEDIHWHMKYAAMQSERGPTILHPEANPRNESSRTGPSRSNRRQHEEIQRHLQRLAMAAAAADAATANVAPSYYYGARGIGGYPPERSGSGSFGATTFSGFSPPTAAQAESISESSDFDFWTRNRFVAPTAPISAPQATDNYLKYGSPRMGHSKSLPESVRVFDYNEFNHSSKD